MDQKMSALKKEAINGLKPKALLGVRHIQAVLLFFALLVAFGMRVNMSMAIVAMTDRDNDDSFDWSMQTRSVILSSFFWGYMIFQIPGGELAVRVGGSVLIKIGVIINMALCVGIPYAAYYYLNQSAENRKPKLELDTCFASTRGILRRCDSLKSETRVLTPSFQILGGWKLVCACRVLQGLSQGLIVPSVHGIVAKWAPLEEKGRIVSFIQSGALLGNAIQLIISGFIADAWGWPAIFYVDAVCGAIWIVFYIIFGADSPQKSKLISIEERLYIQTSLDQIGEQKKLKTPWKSIWTSLPFISLIVVHCGQSWGFKTLMTEMPSYMRQVLGVDIKANGVMTAIPYIAMSLMTFPFGYLTDYLPNRGWLSRTATRKLSNSIGQFGPAIGLIGLSYAPAGNVGAAVALMTLVLGLNAGHITGLMLVHLDMAPNFASTLLGITNCAANIMSIIAPLVAGAVIKDETDPHEWRKVFQISSGVYIVGNLIFVIFGTSEQQKWNNPESDVEEAANKKSQEKSMSIS